MIQNDLNKMENELIDKLKNQINYQTQFIYDLNKMENELIDKIMYLEIKNEMLLTELNDIKQNLEIGLLEKIKDLEFKLEVAKSVIFLRNKEEQFK